MYYFEMQGENNVINRKTKSFCFSFFFSNKKKNPIVQILYFFDF